MKNIEASFNYTDMSSLKELGSGQATDDNLKAAAQQLEGVFLQMVLKSMRQANESFQSSMFDSQTKDTFQDFHDNQLALHLSKSQGMGLADVIYKQLKPYVGEGEKVNNFSIKQGDFRTSSLPSELSTMPVNHAKKEAQEPKDFHDAKDFLGYLKPIVDKVLKGLQLNPTHLLAQAALETGWGKHIIKDVDGNNSHNVFNIKATGWEGDKTNKQTIEYENSQIVKRNEPFRMYENYEQSIKDFVQVLQSPRYEKVWENTNDPKAFFDALQKAGYATDPNYSDKVLKVLHQDEFKNLGADHG